MCSLIAIFRDKSVCMFKVLKVFNKSIHAARYIIIDVRCMKNVLCRYVDVELYAV